MTQNDILLIELGIAKGVEIDDMKRKKDRKQKIVIKTRNCGCTKLYVNGKWQRMVTNLYFHGYVGNFKKLQNQSLRREIIHAFLAESGSQANFEHAQSFGHEETMIDWIAIQFPKIAKVYEKLGILEI